MDRRIVLNAGRFRRSAIACLRNDEYLGFGGYPWTTISFTDGECLFIERKALHGLYQTVVDAFGDDSGRWLMEITADDCKYTGQCSFMPVELCENIDCERGFDMTGIIKMDMGEFLRIVTKELDEYFLYSVHVGDDVVIFLADNCVQFRKDWLLHLIRILNGIFYRCYGGWRLEIEVNEGKYTGRCSFIPAGPDGSAGL